MIVAEPFDPISMCQGGLCGTGFGNPKVIEAKVSWYMGLIMIPEQRPGLRHIGPFGKSLAPPCIVLGNRMKLREIERDGTSGLGHWRRIQSARYIGAATPTAMPRLFENRELIPNCLETRFVQIVIDLTLSK